MIITDKVKSAIPLLLGAGDDNNENTYSGPPVPPSVGELDNGALPIIHFKIRAEGFYEKAEREALCELYDGETVWDTVSIPKEKTGQFAPGKIVEMKFKKRDCAFCVSEQAVVIPPTRDDNDYVAVIKRKSTFCHFPEDLCLYPCYVKCLLPNKILKLFSPIGDYQKTVEDISAYSALRPVQQKKLLERASAPAYPCDTDSEIFTPFVKREDLELMYRMCKHTLSPAMRQMIETNFELCDTKGDYKVRTDALTQISYALNIDITPKRTEMNYTYKEIMDLFDSKLYGMESLKKDIAEFILTAMHSSKSHFKILLEGPPGVGKTSICEVIAEILDKAMVEINCSGKGAIDIFGSNRGYLGAVPSKISQGLRTAGTNKALLLLDEFDKMAANDHNGNPYDAFTDAFDYRCQFSDSFFDDYVTPLDNTAVICTANDISKIPEYIKSRFDFIFHCDGYNADYKVKIAQKHIIPQQLSEANIKENELIFDEDALYEIADNYCTDEGAREMKVYICCCIRKAIKYWFTDEKTRPMVIDCKFIKDNLKKLDSDKKTIGYRV